MDGPITWMFMFKVFMSGFGIGAFLGVAATLIYVAYTYKEE